MGARWGVIIDDLNWQISVGAKPGLTKTSICRSCYRGVNTFPSLLRSMIIYVVRYVFVRVQHFIFTRFIITETQCFLCNLQPFLELLMLYEALLSNKTSSGVHVIYQTSNFDNLP